MIYGSFLILYLRKVSGYTIVNSNDDIKKHIGNYTVKIMRLPKKIISNKDLRDYFEAKFGSEKIFGKIFIFLIIDVQVSQDLIYFSELIDQLLSIEGIYLKIILNS
jgi:hypothetical protein